MNPEETLSFKVNLMKWYPLGRHSDASMSLVYYFWRHWFLIPHQITPLTTQPRQALVDHYTRFWETAHLPLPKADINTYFSLRAKFRLGVGVGGQFPRDAYDPSRCHKPGETSCWLRFCKEKNHSLLIHGLNALLPKLGSNGLFSRTKHLVQLNKISSGSKLESRQLKFR